MNRFPPTLVRGLAAVAIGATAVAGPLAATASAKPHQPDRSALTLGGSGTWVVRDVLGDAVVNGSGELDLGNRGRTTRVDVAAVVAPDDRTLPGPGACEPAVTTVSVYGARGVDLTLIGYGDVCGFDVQPPTSIVTHGFTGTYEVYGDGTRPRRLAGTDGFFEVRLAEDGSASVFAIDT